MDTRIEELAQIILERCSEYKKQQPYDDKAETYKAIALNTMDTLLALTAYRDRHKEDYD